MFELYLHVLITTLMMMMMIVFHNRCCHRTSVFLFNANDRTNDVQKSMLVRDQLPLHAKGWRPPPMRTSNGALTASCLHPQPQRRPQPTWQRLPGEQLLFPLPCICPRSPGFQACLDLIPSLLGFDSKLTWI